MRCIRCGGALMEVRETMPYVGPGPYVVELRDVRALKCSACGSGDVRVPERQALDILVRALWAEQPRHTPQLLFEQGRWRVAHRGHADGTSDHTGETA